MQKKKEEILRKRDSLPEEIKNIELREIELMSLREHIQEQENNLMNIGQG
jgi:hypothetical protein